MLWHQKGISGLVTRIDHESIVGAQAVLQRLAFFGNVTDSAAGVEGGLSLLDLLEGVPLVPFPFLDLVFFASAALAGLPPLLPFPLRGGLLPVLFPALSSFNSFAKCLQQDPTYRNRGLKMIPGINLPLKTESINWPVS